MLQLQLPSYQFNIKKSEKGLYILDSYRKRWVKLTPEEWVRQNFLRYLISEKHFPAALLSVECQLIINGMKRRCDALFYNKNMKPLVIIEFKAPNVPITQEVFDQAAVYNSKLNVDYLIVSNGMEHYCCYVNNKTLIYNFFEEIPNFTQL